MWRTAGALLFVSLTLTNAIQNLENVEFAKVHGLNENGPVQLRVVNENADALVADAPVKQVSNDQHESSFAGPLRFVRNNAESMAFRAVGVVQPNQHADAGAVTIPTSGSNVDLTFGDADKGVKITTKLSLDDDVFFVYGKSCAGKVCKDTEVKNVYDTTGKTPETTKFDLQNMYGTASGNNYKDTVSMSKVISIPGLVFGVADAGTKDVVESPAEGYFGLGFTNNAKSAYGTVKTLLSNAKPNKTLVIYRDEKLQDGAIYLGSDSYSKCPKKYTGLLDVAKASGGVNQWWFTAKKVEVDGVSVDNQIVKINLNLDNFELTKEQVDKINAKLDKTTNMIDDQSKLPSVKITVGDNVIELDGSTYSAESDKKYMSLAFPAARGDYQIQLGRGALKKLCVVLSQKDAATDAYQMGLYYKEPGSFSTSTTVSFFSMIMLPLVYFMQL